MTGTELATTLSTIPTLVSPAPRSPGRAASLTAWARASYRTYGATPGGSRRLLHDHRDALPHTYAHRRQAQLDLGPAPHLVQQGSEDASPRAAQRVPEGDGPAIRVQPLVLWIHTPLVQDRQDLRGECLVQLDEADVVQREPRPLQCLCGGRHRPYPHDLWRHPRHSHAPYPGEGLYAVDPGELSGDHERRRGP